MILDTRTIILCLVINTTAVGAIILAYASGEDTRINRALRVFGLGNITSTAGWLLVAMRGYIPLLLSVAAGNLMLVYGVGEFYQALRLFTGHHPFRRWTNLAIILGTIFNLIFLLIWDNYTARVVGSSLILAGIQGYCAYIVLRIQSAPNPVLRWVSFSTFSFTTLLNLVRLVVALLVNNVSPNGAALLENNTFQSIFYASMFLGLSMIITSFTLLCQDYVTRQFKSLSMIDPLTELYNRREFEIRVLAAINHAQRSHEPLSMLMADADDFKQVNDTYGHEAGDAALKHMADLLRMHTRAQDTIGRLGGDEFAILLPGLDADQAGEMTKRIERIIEESPLHYIKGVIPLAFSTGLAMLNPDRPSFNDMLHQADVSLYAAKRARKLG